MPRLWLGLKVFLLHRFQSSFSLSLNKLMLRQKSVGKYVVSVSIERKLHFYQGLYNVSFKKLVLVVPPSNLLQVIMFIMATFGT